MITDWLDPVSYKLGQAAGGGGGGGATATVIKTAYTSASDSTDALIPIPTAAGHLLCIGMMSQTAGTVIGDFAMGELLSSYAMPVDEADLSLKTAVNGCYSTRRLDNGNYLSQNITQSASDVVLSYGRYKLHDGMLEVHAGMQARFLAGITYDVTFYFLAG